MLRDVLEIVLPLLLPTVLYFLWVVSVRPRAAVDWATLPWVWLAGAGALLVAIVLFLAAVDFGSPKKGVYVPPRWEGGRIVPGHIRPETRQ
jgi:Family of unknown function (DUF6111)